MTIKFYSTNLIDQAEFTVTNENLLFPVNNLTDERRTKVLRTTTDTDSVVFDFQETSEIDSIFVVDNWRDGFGISTLGLDLNATSNFTSPAYTNNGLTFSVPHGLGYLEFTQQDYRFARVRLTSTLAYCELSKLFIGKKISLLNERSINYGWSYVDKELSTTKKNRYGQEFTDVIGRQRAFNISFSNLSKDHLDQIFEIYDDKGSTKPFYIRIGCDEMINEKRRFAGMVKMTQVPSITNQKFNKYNLSMSLDEVM